MDKSEQAARLMLGDLDEPAKPIRDLLADLVTDARLSPGEEIAVDLARQIWAGRGSSTLAEALRQLDKMNFTNLLRALAVLRPDSMHAATLALQ